MEGTHVRDYCSRESFRSCARALCDALTKSGGRALERVSVEEPPQRMCVCGRLSPTGCPDRIRTCPVRRLTRSRYSIFNSCDTNDGERQSGLPFLALRGDGFGDVLLELLKQSEVGRFQAVVLRVFPVTSRKHVCPEIK